jgi:hypothetical protein
MDNFFKLFVGWLVGWWETNGTETEAQGLVQLMCSKFLNHKQWHMTLLQGLRLQRDESHVEN